MKQQSLQLTESQLESDVEKLKVYLARKQEHANRQASKLLDFPATLRQPLLLSC